MRKLGVPDQKEFDMGATMQAAVQALQQLQAKRLVLAIPVASREALKKTTD